MISDIDYWDSLMESQAMGAMISAADRELAGELFDIYMKHYEWDTPEEYVANILAIRAELGAPAMRPRVQALFDKLDAAPHYLWHRPQVRGTFAFD